MQATATWSEGISVNHAPVVVASPPTPHRTAAVLCRKLRTLLQQRQATISNAMPSIVHFNGLASVRSATVASVRLARISSSSARPVMRFSAMSNRSATTTGTHRH